MTRFFAVTRYLIIISIIGLGIAAAVFFCIWRYWVNRIVD